MTDSDVTAAYRRAFARTEDNAVRRMLDFVETLPPAPPVGLVRRRRWIVPAGVAAAVAAVAITTVTVATGGPQSAEPMAPGPAGAAPGPAAASTSSAPPSMSPMPTPSPTASSTRPTTRSPRSITRTVPTPASSPQSAAATAPPPPVPSTTSPGSLTSTVAPTTPTVTVSSRGGPLTAPGPTVNAAAGTTAATTYPALGDPGITGPLKPYANPAAYTKTPAGLAVRANADDIYSPHGVAAQFTIYITTPNPDPKVVVGGYLVMVAAPSINYQSIDGQGPSAVPTGTALHLGDRSWRWNADHTLLISTAADADIYIGVLATRAMNEFEPTIPTGYTAADIELIAAGIHT